MLILIVYWYKFIVSVFSALLSVFKIEIKQLIAKQAVGQVLMSLAVFCFQSSLLNTLYFISYKPSPLETFNSYT